jgi:hypothetical protein
MDRRECGGWKRADRVRPAIPRSPIARAIVTTCVYILVALRSRRGLMTARGASALARSAIPEGNDVPGLGNSWQSAMSRSACGSSRPHFGA